MKKILCKIITLGRHWWYYGPSRTSRFPAVRCTICGYIPENQWGIFKKMFKGKEKGRVTR